METTRKLKVGQHVGYKGSTRVVSGRITEVWGDGLYTFRPDGQTNGGWAVGLGDLILDSEAN